MTNSDSDGDRSKRKRKNASSSKAAGKKSKQLPLSNLVVAISTKAGQEKSSTSADEKKEAASLSYKSVQEICRVELGATVSSQIHKRVHCLIATSASLEKSTQRVRKALKLGIPIVDIEWVHACRSRKQKVDFEPQYRVDQLARTQHANNKEHQQKSNKKDDAAAQQQHEYQEVPEEGWTEPVACGCCCVCHENGDPDCPWCLVGCDINQKK